MGARPRAFIVGAGPAGCAAGVVLAKNGISPILVEKGSPGKDKACGDAWIPSALQELRAFDTEKRALDSNTYSFARIDGYCSDRKVWSLDLAPFGGVIGRNRRPISTRPGFGGRLPDLVRRPGDRTAHQRPRGRAYDPARS